MTPVVAPEGKTETLESLYERHIRAVWGYARWWMPEYSRAEDLVSEAFCTLARRIRERGMPEDPLGYLLATVRSRAIDERRRRRFLPLEAPAAASRGRSPSEAAGESERRRCVLEAMRALDPELAEAVALKVFAGLTFEASAAVSGVPRGTVESRYESALEKLSVLLREWKS